MILYDHQIKSLQETAAKNRCAYYLDMGLGKTFVGSEKMKQLANKQNIIICQKSKVSDWIDHVRQYYPEYQVWDLTKKGDFEAFFSMAGEYTTDAPIVGVINYELCFRRPDLLRLKHFTLMLDESSLISNETTKRAKFVLKLVPDNVILLSGTPTSGKYEKLWSQVRLLGWNITKKGFYGSYVVEEVKSYYGGFVQKQVVGYKNEDHLKKKLREYGCVFMKTEEVMSLPEKIEQKVMVPVTSEYKKFTKNCYIVIDDVEMVGANTLTKILYQRLLCGAYNPEKHGAFSDLVESTEDRLIVFYNFNHELDVLQKICEAAQRPISVVNGKVKDLTAYENESNSVTFIQYQAGAYGLNLQKANKIIYFSLPLGKGSCDLWEQSKKRIHRIGQSRTCFYYYLLAKNSIEEWNLSLLEQGKELTDKLFEHREKQEEKHGTRKTI